jgi:hypothetical protein
VAITSQNLSLEFKSEIYMPYMRHLNNKPRRDKLHTHTMSDTEDLQEQLINASHDGHLAIVTLLLQDERVDPSDSDNNWAIRCASTNGHIEIVNLLLQDPRVDPSADNNSSIQYASDGGHLEVVERLLQDSRVDPSAEDNYSIQHASEGSHLAVVERLLQDSRVDPNVLQESFPFIPLEAFSRESIGIFATKLKFTTNSTIIHWKPLIDKYLDKYNADLNDLFNMFRDNEENKLNHFQGDEIVNLVVDYLGFQNLGTYSYHLPPEKQVSCLDYCKLLIPTTLILILIFLLLE